MCFSSNLDHRYWDQRSKGSGATLFPVGKRCGLPECCIFGYPCHSAHIHYAPHIAPGLTYGHHNGNMCEPVVRWELVWGACVAETQRVELKGKETQGEKKKREKQWHGERAHTTRAHTQNVMRWHLQCAGGGVWLADGPQWWPFEEWQAGIAIESQQCWTSITRRSHSAFSTWLIAIVGRFAAAGRWH